MEPQFPSLTELQKKTRREKDNHETVTKKKLSGQRQGWLPDRRAGQVGNRPADLISKKEVPVPANGLKVGLSMLCVLILLASSACVPKRHRASAKTEPVIEKVGNHDNGWWKAAFFVTWPEDEDPLWHVDLLIAHRVIWPVLRQFDHHMVVWRFHRRAVRDKTGHQFSFIFYCSAPTAQKVFDAIRADHDLRAMRDRVEGILQKFELLDL